MIRSPDLRRWRAWPPPAGCSPNRCGTPRRFQSRPGPRSTHRGGDAIGVGARGYLKLAASRELKRPFDRPEAVWRRYGGKRSTPTHATWCEHAAITGMAPGMLLVLALPEPAMVRYGFDGWHQVVDAPTLPNSLGVHVLTIDTACGTCARTTAGFHVQIHAWGPLGGSGLSREHRLRAESHDQHIVSRRRHGSR